MPQQFEPATSYQVRDELQELIRRDLLGPWDGEHEQLRNMLGPSERYLVGRLGPRTTTAPAAATLPDLAAAEAAGDASETDLPEVLTPQSLGKLWASSMGLSFAVPSDVDVVVVTATWGHYGRQEVEIDNGRRRTVWAREPVSYRLEVRLDQPQPLSLHGTDPGEPGVRLDVQVRARDRRRVVRVVLINGRPEPAERKDTAWLFQPALSVTALDGDSALFLPVDDPAGAPATTSDDREEAHLRLLYRAWHRFAVGHNVAVQPHVRAGDQRAHRLQTDWLPVCDVPATVAPDRHRPGRGGAVHGRARPRRAGRAAHRAAAARRRLRSLAG